MISKLLLLETICLSSYLNRMQSSIVDQGTIPKLVNFIFELQMSSYRGSNCGHCFQPITLFSLKLDYAQSSLQYKVYFLIANEVKQKHLKEAASGQQRNSRENVPLGVFNIILLNLNFLWNLPCYPNFLTSKLLNFMTDLKQDSIGPVISFYL